MDPPPSFMSLPSELQHMIYRYVDLWELAVCARVNSQWNIVITPFIWHSLDIVSQKQGILFMRAETQEALKRNTGHIKDLHINLQNLAVYRSIFMEKRIVCYANATICTSLRKLRVYNRLPALLPFTLRRNLIGLVQQNPGLAELRVSTALFHLSTYKETICSAPSLRRLWVDSGVRPEHIRAILSVLPETIEDITFMVDNNAEHVDVPKGTEITMPHLPSLRRIAFKGDQAGVGISVLLSLLCACSKLTAFEATTIQPFRDDSIRAALANFGIFLEKITPGDLPSAMKADDSEIASTLSLSSRHMKHVDLRLCKQAGRLTVAAILDNCESLEYLDLSGHGDMPSSKIGSKDLQMILCKAPRLKSFVTISSGVASGQFDAFLEADDILGSEWATISLTEFHCGIVVPRPDQHRRPGVPGHDEATPELEESRAIQRQIYARLATQKGMREMRFGPKFKPEAAQSHHLWDSLEMTLESGLGQLSDLKYMEALNVCGTDHWIGVRELEWMRAHWPNMEEIQGLFQKVQALTPENEAWILNFEPEWVSDWPTDNIPNFLWCDTFPEVDLRSESSESSNDDIEWEFGGEIEDEESDDEYEVQGGNIEEQEEV